MIDAEEFEELVHSALSHLYDHSYLLRHPLARLLGAGTSADYRANSLRRLLLDAIQDLKPPREAPADTPAARHYRYLYMRYVEARPVAEIARGLAVTDRQTRRRHRDALAALSRVLRERLRDHVAVTDRQPTAADVSLSQDSLLDLELERIHAGRQDRTFDVADVLAGAVHTVTALATARGVTTSLATGTERLLVEADRVVVREALLETLAHAICETEARHVQVSVSTDDRMRTIEILGVRSGDRDIGRGDARLPAQLVEAQRLVRSQKGAMAARATDAGTAIVLSLPLARPKVVLVVDDNPDMLHLYRRFLAGSGYHRTATQSSDEALRIARETRPACIILDVMMPLHDGWELLQLLRGDPLTREIPVLVCTVLQQTELARSLGADGFLAKPVTQRSLLDAIERCCKGRGDVSPIAAGGTT